MSRVQRIKSAPRNRGLIFKVDDITTHFSVVVRCLRHVMLCVARGARTSGRDSQNVQKVEDGQEESRSRVV